MKPTTALKPLVFALAALMAFAAQAAGPGVNGHPNSHGSNNNPGNNHDPQGPNLDQILQITGGAGAAVLDVQNSGGSRANNRGTQNDAKVENSLNGSNGNMGANVAAGDGNQQDNAAALASADESFIFGTAVAVSNATQRNANNRATNYASTNNASLNNAGNNGSGNIGINVTAGQFNQQKNNLAVAVSGGLVAQAAAAANQSSTGMEVNNGIAITKTETLERTFSAQGTFGPAETSGSSGSGSTPSDFTAVGVFGLSGVYTKQVLTPDGWKNPVTNNATMSNSMNGFSGNGGANVSSGAGNQQSNSLSIAAGCKTCL